MNSYSGSGFVIIQFRANPHNAYIYGVHKESFRVSHDPDLSACYASVSFA